MYHSPEKKILVNFFVYGYSFIYSLEITKAMLTTIEFALFFIQCC